MPEIAPDGRERFLVDHFGAQRQTVAPRQNHQRINRCNCRRPIFELQQDLILRLQPDLFAASQRQPTGNKLS